MTSVGDELPLAHIKRIVKTKLTELMNELGPDKSGKAQDGYVQKEALLAFGEAAKIFIHCLTHTSNDICRDGRRQTISVDDVFRAVEELEFAEFTEPLKLALEGETASGGGEVLSQTECAHFCYLCVPTLCTHPPTPSAHLALR
jgi:DNA polymerase epsilon subunit 3